MLGKLTEAEHEKVLGFFNEAMLFADEPSVISSLEGRVLAFTTFACGGKRLDNMELVTVFKIFVQNESVQKAAKTGDISALINSIYERSPYTAGDILMLEALLE